MLFAVILHSYDCLSISEVTLNGTGNTYHYQATIKHYKTRMVCILLGMSLQWRHNEFDGVLNHQRLDCLLNRLFRRRSKKTSKLRVTGLCEGNSPVTGEFPAQRASNAENASHWWRHHEHKPDLRCPRFTRFQAHPWLALIPDQEPKQVVISTVGIKVPPGTVKCLA